MLIGDKQLGMGMDRTEAQKKKKKKERKKERRKKKKSFRNVTGEKFYRL